MSNDVVEVAMCATEWVMLKPDQLYLFFVTPGCKRCEEMARQSQGDQGDATGLKCDD